MNATAAPKVPRKRRDRIVAAELGQLWSALIQRGAGAEFRSLGLCAIGEHEGEDGLAADLASFLGSRGLRVALVEATLRAPQLARRFGVAPVPGLGELLEGSAEPEAVVRLDAAPGVDLVVGGAARDPYWGFTNGAFPALLHRLGEERDLCLVSLPALSHAPEAPLVLRSLDAVVLAVAAGRHRPEQVRRQAAAMRAADVPLLGAVLLDVVHDLPVGLAGWIG